MMKWLSGLVAVIGLWIAVSPAIFDATDTGLWNNVIVGAAILLIAGFNFYRIMNGQSSLFAAMGLVVLLGAWTIIAPFAIDIGVDELLWSGAIAGVLVVLFGGYVALTTRSVRMAIPETEA